MQFLFRNVVVDVILVLRNAVSCNRRSFLSIVEAFPQKSVPLLVSALSYGGLVVRHSANAPGIPVLVTLAG